MLKLSSSRVLWELYLICSLSCSGNFLIYILLVMTRLNEISEQMMLQSKMLQVMLEEPPQHTAQLPAGVEDQVRGVSGEGGGITRSRLLSL